MTEELLTVEGTVASIIYRNEENGYTVLRLDAGETGGELTAVGCMPGVMPGESLSLRGRWGRHPSFGAQFKAEVVERRLPEGAGAILEYLSSRAIPGIGPRTAQKLVALFGANTLTVLEESPEQLTQVRGITRKRALEIQRAFLQQSGMRRLLEFLSAHQLPQAIGVELWRRYGGGALEVVRDNPYLLVDEELGIPFSAADGLAIGLGMAADDPLRTEAGLLFELSHNAGNGHTFLPRGKLLAATARLLGVEEPALEPALSALVERGEVIADPVAGQDACYLAELYEAEVYVAHRLREMSRRDFCPPAELERILADIQREQQIAYAPLQKQAVELAARRQVVLLTGGPGTGKTTSLRGILGLFDAMGMETALAAPTGGAAKRLGELCGVEAQTIHRLLETGHDPSTGRLVFCKNEQEPLKADAVIVDETSMVDVPLMAALLAAVRDDCRLILVGDPDQLPSVGPGSLLDHLLRSGRIPSVALTEIFRQARESAIVMNAHRVNQGEMPDLSNRTADFFFLRRKDGPQLVETIVELCKSRLPEHMGIPAAQIQVLSPTRKYAAGTANLNRALQAALNPPREGAGERRFGETVFREGDRVMQVKNNYDVMWREKNGLRAGMGIFNGDIGQIESIDRETILVNFDQRMVEYTGDMLGELEPAYAVTVHKAQGSEYRAVVLAALDGAPMLLSRGVLYTAITRARELMVVVGDEGVIAAMTANNRQTRRYCGLRARLAEE